MKQLQVLHHPVSEFVFMEGNQVVTDSLTMAQMFGKEHKNVIRDVEVQLEKLAEANEMKWNGGSSTLSIPNTSIIKINSGIQNLILQKMHSQLLQ